MARPYWSGQITISLVSFSVKLFVATEAKGEIHFHQISRSTGERVKYQKVTASAQQLQEQSGDDAPAANIQNNEIVKGYEYRKGEYITLEPKELADLRIPSKHTMEVTQFVDESELPPEFFEKPYFVVPESDAQTEAFLTVRKALLDTKKLAISKVAFAGREHVVAIAPAGTEEHGGMMAYTMRYAAELRKPEEYFRDVKKHAVDEDSLGLAKELIKRKAGKFDPEKFVDGYEVALKELVEAKVKHQPIPVDAEPAKAKGKVINLMDALRKSVSSKAEDVEDEDVVPAKKLTLVKGGKPAAKKVAAKTVAKSAKRKTA